MLYGDEGGGGSREGGEAPGRRGGRLRLRVKGCNEVKLLLVPLAHKMLTANQMIWGISREHQEAMERAQSASREGGGGGVGDWSLRILTMGLLLFPD